MKLTNQLLTTVLMIALAFYGFNQIGNYLVNSVNGTAKDMQKAGK